MNNQQSDLHQLDYTQQWLDYEILKDAQLKAQLTALAKGEDEHTEHYRYKTLNGYITARSSLTNEVLIKLPEVIVNDPDPSMSSSAVTLLLKQAYLTNEQFEMAIECLISFGEWTRKEVARQIARRSKCDNL